MDNNELIAIAVGDKDIESLKAGEPWKLGDFSSDLPQLANVVIVYQEETDGILRELQGGSVPKVLQDALSKLVPPNSDRTLPVVRYDFEVECPQEAGMVFSITHQFQKAVRQAKDKANDTRQQVASIIGRELTSPTEGNEDITKDQIARAYKVTESAFVQTWFCHMLGYLEETGQIENFLDGVSLSATAVHRAEHRKRMKDGGL